MIAETNMAIYLWSLVYVLKFSANFDFKDKFFTWNSTSWFGTSWLNSFVTVRPFTVVSDI